MQGGIAWDWSQGLVPGPIAEAAALLARGAHDPSTIEAKRAFDGAVERAQQFALPRLWLATVSDADSMRGTVDAALRLDLGPPPWRMACGEVLLALGIRARRDPGTAFEILVESSYALPQDPRPWLALASVAVNEPTRIAFGERAHALFRPASTEVRVSLLWLLLSSAHSDWRNGRLTPARETVLRAARLAKDDPRLWALAADLAPWAEDAASILNRSAAANREDRDFLGRVQRVRARSGESWSRWGAAPGKGGTWRSDNARALADLEADYGRAETLLKALAAPAIAAEFLQSASRWTAQVVPGTAAVNDAGYASGQWPWP